MRMLALVLLPQQREGHLVAAPGEFLPDPRPVPLRAVRQQRAHHPALSRIQPPLGSPSSSAAIISQQLSPAIVARRRQSDTAALLQPIARLSCRRLWIRPTR